MAEPNLSSSALNIHLFGPAALTRNGQPTEPALSRKGLWLLALLALRNERRVERDWLAGVLWPESMQSQALDSLRHSLTDLRKALGQEAARLQAPTFQTLCLNVSGEEVDVLEFDAAVRQGDVVSLERAVALYRGPLLEGCTEEWVLPEREAREQAYLQALETLAQQEMERQDFKAATSRLRLVIAVDPFRESGQRSLMQALAAGGDYAAAVQVYRALRLLLHRELHTEPDPQTLALFEQIRAEAQRRAQTRPATSSPLASSLPPASPRRLPHPLTALVGRRQEVEQIVTLLHASRLVTLSGPGGVGKTRLAIAVAEAVADDYRDGAVFVELAALSDPALVPNAAASVLELREEPGRPLPAALRDYLASRKLLLVLDNCEHLIEACARLAEALLGTCADLRILATSRQALGLTGEQVWSVPSLSLPASPALADAAKETEKEWLSLLFEYEAIRLFVERAQQAVPNFQMSGQNTDAVAQICCRLDGIPLAIELAAARIRALTVAQIAARLDDCLGLLTGGSRTALPRHQTLRATLDWSYDLLTELERLLLRRLCVFVGGWTLEAAEAVCSGEGIEAREVLDLLTSLVDKSLVVFAEGREGDGRYRLLETIRQYGQERLEEIKEVTELRGRHRDFFLALAEEAEPHLYGSEEAVWLGRLETEHVNLRAALAWCQAEEAAQAGLRLVGALWWFWWMRGYLSMGRTYLAEALGREGAAGPTQERAKALIGAGQLAWFQGDYKVAGVLFEESLAIARELRDRKTIALALHGLGLVVRDQGDYGAAGVFNRESLAIRREIGDKWGIAASLNGLAVTAHRLGNYGEARSLFEEGLAIRRELGDKRSIASILDHLGNVACDQGDYRAARALHRESLALKREFEDKTNIVFALEAFARLAVVEGQPERAVRLWGAASAGREAIGLPLTFVEQEKIDRNLAAVHEALGAAAFAAAWAEGRAMTMEQAVEYVLAGSET